MNIPTQRAELEEAWRREFGKSNFGTIYQVMQWLGIKNIRTLERKIAAGYITETRRRDGKRVITRDAAINFHMVF